MAIKLHHSTIIQYLLGKCVLAKKRQYLLEWLLYLYLVSFSYGWRCLWPDVSAYKQQRRRDICIQHSCRKLYYFWPFRVDGLFSFKLCILHYKYCKIPRSFSSGKSVLFVYVIFETGYNAVW